MKPEMKQEPKERPILFSSAMVNAIIEGRKTQTRRVVKPQPHHTTSEFTSAADWGVGEAEWFKPVIALPDFEGDVGSESHKAALAEFDANPNESIHCPYGKPGDRLWVRESFTPRYFDDNSPAYKADWTTGAAEYVTEPKWKPSIHMPRALSRITLEITNVRVERLQEISEEDAKAEGVERQPRSNNDVYGEDYREAFQRLWDKINGKKHPWESNPWVWCVSFRRIDG
jgi:hypothetical protein